MITINNRKLDNTPIKTPLLPEEYFNIVVDGDREFGFFRATYDTYYLFKLGGRNRYSSTPFKAKEDVTDMLDDYFTLGTWKVVQL